MRQDRWICRARYERKFHGVQWLLGLWVVPHNELAFHYWLLMEMGGKSRYDYPGQYAYRDKIPMAVQRWVGAKRIRASLQGLVPVRSTMSNDYPTI